MAQVLERLNVQEIQKEQTGLVLVAAFLYANQGQLDKAKPLARTLRELAPNRRVIQAYADYLITGARPADKL